MPFVTPILNLTKNTLECYFLKFELSILKIQTTAYGGFPKLFKKLSDDFVINNFCNFLQVIVLHRIQIIGFVLLIFCILYYFSIYFIKKLYLLFLII